MTLLSLLSGRSSSGSQGARDARESKDCRTVAILLLAAVWDGCCKVRKVSARGQGRAAQRRVRLRALASPSPCPGSILPVAVVDARGARSQQTAARGSRGSWTGPWGSAGAALGGCFGWSRSRPNAVWLCLCLVRLEAVLGAGWVSVMLHGTLCTLQRRWGHGRSAQDRRRGSCGTRAQTQSRRRGQFRNNGCRGASTR